MSRLVELSEETLSLSGIAHMDEGDMADEHVEAVSLMETSSGFEVMDHRSDSTTHLSLWTRGGLTINDQPCHRLATALTHHMSLVRAYHEPLILNDPPNDAEEL